MQDKDLETIAERLDRLAKLIERAVPPAPAEPDFAAADAFVWQTAGHRLVPVAKVNRVPMRLLKGIDRARDILHENTERFARGLPANNALLWGARGMGKSSLVKAVHAEVNAGHSGDAAGAPVPRDDIRPTAPPHPARSAGAARADLSPPGRGSAQPPAREGLSATPASHLKLIEIHREDIETLPELMALLRGAAYRFILFCDDLSFDGDDTSYKSLKAALEGGIEGRPENVVFYATSNRRHLLPRDMMENERSTAINPHEAVEEKVSLSDRFGLWLGFHKCSQDEYLEMVRGYAAEFGLTIARAEMEASALEWATTRGARSGRVAWQFVQDLAGRLGVPLRG
ncbi:MAG TPA: ATP-binding protein [Bauldia sp.]|nr:ATP-binding protein [Bauldia sp.]